MRFTWQHLSIIIVALVLIGGIGWFTMEDNGNIGPKKLWFYDLNTGELFPADVSEPPPIAAPSGNLNGADAGVLASVIRIEGASAPTVAFLQTYTPQAKEMIQASRQGKDHGVVTYDKIQAGTLVALPPAKPGNEPQWVSMSSPEGYKITMVVETLAKGKPFTADLP